jgi:hypothetical protein
MTTPKLLNLIGGILLTCGVLAALISNNYTSRVMGKAALGVAILGDEPDSSFMKEKERLLGWANFWFYAGVALALLGGTLQTLGSLLPFDH